MNWQQLAHSLRDKISGELLVNEPMKNHTTWRIGGPADLLLIPYSSKDISSLAIEANKYNIPITVVGNGSNILVKDSGIRGIVIKINGNMGKVTVNHNQLEAEAGVTLPVLAKIAAEHSLTGLEFAMGIPATLGGAINMNAGALGGEIGKLVTKIACIDHSGNVDYLQGNEIKFSYRQAIFPQDYLVVAKAWIKLQQGNATEIKLKMQELATKRRKSQPLNKPNAGSIFKNPQGNFAGKLIEEAGLKGLQIGDAQVSIVHANFIVNLGNATASQVLDLIEIVKDRVLQQSGVQLQLEVKVLGEDLTI